MTPLERRYRRLLRLIPAYHRRGREDDMVAAFLQRTLPVDPEDAEFTSEHGRPSSSDVAGVATLALRLRLGGSGASPRHRAWGAALRRVALLGLLAQSVLVLANSAAQAWYTWRVAPWAEPDASVQVSGSSGWQVTLTALGVLWVAAYLALTGGFRRTARLLAVLALVPSVVSFARNFTMTEGITQLATFCWLLAWLLAAAVPVLALAAFHPDSPPVRARPWLLALPVGAGFVVLLLLILSRHPDFGAGVDLPGIACGLICAAGLTCLFVPWGEPRRSWLLTLTLLAVGVLALRTVSWAFYLEAVRSGVPRALLTAGAVEVAVTLAVTTALVLLARRDLRALPTPG